MISDVQYLVKDVCSHASYQRCGKALNFHLGSTWITLFL